MSSRCPSPARSRCWRSVWRGSAPDGAAGERGFRCLQKLYESGLLIKWTGDTGIVAPPLIAEESHIEEIGDLLERTLAAL